jgi:hypothetical protein
MEARRVVSTSHEVLVRLSAFSRVSRCWCSPSGCAPRRRLAFALRERWGGNLGLAAVDTLLLRTVPWITAVGSCGLANARGLGASRGHRLCDLVGCRPLGRSRWISRFTSSTGSFTRCPRSGDCTGCTTRTRSSMMTTVALPPVGDAALRGFKAAWSSALGPPVVAVVLFESCSMPSSLFSHANLAAPGPRRSRCYARVLVTPRTCDRVHTLR